VEVSGAIDVENLRLFLVQLVEGEFGFLYYSPHFLFSGGLTPGTR